MCFGPNGHHQVGNNEFLGLTIEETLSWKCHTNHILSKLCLACYAIRVITPLMTDDTLKMIYYSYVHSIITYGIIFWGNSPHSIHIFKTQKRIIRIMTKSRRRDSCRQLFKKYILSTIPFVVKNKELFKQIKKFITLTQDVIRIYIPQ